MEHSKRNHYIQTEFGSLVGKTIKRVRALTDAELDEFMWYQGEIAPILEFTDGTFAIVSRDDEGNGAGTLWLGQYEKTARQTALS